MNRYFQATVAWYENIACEGRENPSPHRRKICQNYLEHAALEYSDDRWPEIFTPLRTIAHPHYEVRWGTPETVVYDGEDAVKGFYTALKSGGALSNENELLSVADWGFSSFHTSNLFRTATQALEESWIKEAPEPDALYVVSTRTAMFWLYDEQARLKGEYVYEMEPSTVNTTTPDEWLSADDLAELIKPYLPHGPEIGTADAFRNVVAQQP